MMIGYHNQPEKTRRGRVVRPEGERFIRTGDVGRFDDDGFLTLMDRKKDMIISRRLQHLPERPRGGAAAASGGGRGRRGRRALGAWGETPVAFVVRATPATHQRRGRCCAVGQRALGKTQRLADVRVRRRAAAQRHRQGAEARTARRDIVLALKPLGRPAPAHEGGGNGLLWVLLAAAVLFAVVRPRLPMDYVRLVDWQTIGALAGLLAITQGVERSGMLQADPAAPAGRAPTTCAAWLCCCWLRAPPCCRRWSPTT